MSDNVLEKRVLSLRKHQLLYSSRSLQAILEYVCLFLRMLFGFCTKDLLRLLVVIMVVNVWSHRESEGSGNKASK